MIKTLVVDDDFRVAGIHAARVAKVEGFECVGQVYSAAAAREAIARLHPDLLLLDVHLPDEDRLSLLRSLQAAGTKVDCIIITAAQDLATVKSAMSSGAVYYLAKPFSSDRLRTNWRHTRDGGKSWRPHQPLTRQPSTASATRAPPGSGSPPPRRACSPPCKKALDAVRAADGPVSAAEISDRLGISRPTAQRYLNALERKGLLILDLTYGSTGRGPSVRDDPVSPHCLPGEDVR
ncbi:response regulator [Arthrobacter sp. UYEF20]|uniref:response regulator n=1 Tax=Arthrobacter sp. UYEF20 TaxID=1756363 RepID=UPI0033934598